MALTRRIVPTRFGQMHLRSEGRGGRALLLLHPSPRSAAIWEPLQSRLQRTSVAPDRLGYGCSDAPPWALTIEQYAQGTIDALAAAGIDGPLDLFGVGVGAVEAVEIAHRLGDRASRVAVGAVPMFSAEELERQMEKYSEQPLKPTLEGGHLLGAWRAGFAFRAPPYDLSILHRRFVDLVLAANPGAALRAAAAYPLAKRLRALRVPITVFAMRDELFEQTTRVRDLLGPADSYVELSDLGFDALELAADRVAALLAEHLVG
ncbi:MAG: alpha/beta hydrolase [Gammaproteobacteria bacterium]|nr:alpha/beta hydrolase [Gammaproteobacteria bacterium]